MVAVHELSVKPTQPFPLIDVMHRPLIGNRTVAAKSSDSVTSSRAADPAAVYLLA